MANIQRLLGIVKGNFEAAERLEIQRKAHIRICDSTLRSIAELKFGLEVGATTTYVPKSGRKRHYYLYGFKGFVNMANQTITLCVVTVKIDNKGKFLKSNNRPIVTDFSDDHPWKSITIPISQIDYLMGKPSDFDSSDFSLGDEVVDVDMGSKWSGTVVGKHGSLVIVSYQSGMTHISYGAPHCHSIKKLKKVNP